MKTSIETSDLSSVVQYETVRKIRHGTENLFKPLTAWVDLRSLPRRSRIATHQIVAPHTTTVLHSHKQEYLFGMHTGLLLPSPYLNTISTSLDAYNLVFKILRTLDAAYVKFYEVQLFQQVIRVCARQLGKPATNGLKWETA